MDANGDAEVSALEGRLFDARPDETTTDFKASAWALYDVANDLLALLRRRTAGADAAVYAELDKAVAKFPTWPTDPLHALGVLHEEVGELAKEVLQLVYEPHKTSMDEVRKEALQTAAMALRFFRSLDRYTFTPGPQHSQTAPPAAGEKA